jgi:hypothetical protein
MMGELVAVEKLKDLLTAKERVFANDAARSLVAGRLYTCLACHRAFFEWNKWKIVPNKAGQRIKNADQVKSNTHIHTHTHKEDHTHTHTHTRYTQTHTHPHNHTQTHTHTHTHTHKKTQTHIHTHIHTNKQIQIHAKTHANIHKHKHRPPSKQRRKSLRTPVNNSRLLSRLLQIPSLNAKPLSTEQ